MRNKIGIICMVLGGMLVLAALSLLLWNDLEDSAAGKSVERILPRVIQQIEAPPTMPAGEVPSYPDPYDPALTEVEIDGYAYIGYISIPSVGLKLPIMSEWDYARLKIAPCRFSGSTKTDNLVICAHNFDRHFGPIRNLSPGDTMYFTDMDGTVWKYEVDTLDVLAPTQVEDMTAGDYDLTLFTCTYGGATRVAVRCERVD